MRACVRASERASGARLYFGTNTRRPQFNERERACARARKLCVPTAANGKYDARASSDMRRSWRVFKITFKLFLIVCKCRFRMSIGARALALASLDINTKSTAATLIDCYKMRGMTAGGGGDSGGSSDGGGGGGERSFAADSILFCLSKKTRSGRKNLEFAIGKEQHISKVARACATLVNRRATITTTTKTTATTRNEPTSKPCASKQKRQPARSATKGQNCAAQ